MRDCVLRFCWLVGDQANLYSEPFVSEKKGDDHHEWKEALLLGCPGTCYDRIGENFSWRGIF